MKGVSVSLELWRVDLALSLKITPLGEFVAMTQPRAPALIQFPYKIGAGLSLSLGCWIRREGALTQSRVYAMGGISESCLTAVSMLCCPAIIFLW